MAVTASAAPIVRSVLRVLRHHVAYVLLQRARIAVVLAHGGDARRCRLFLRMHVLARPHAALQLAAVRHIRVQLVAGPRA